jgi:hypothetical protein
LAAVVPPDDPDPAPPDELELLLELVAPPDEEEDEELLELPELLDEELVLAPELLDEELVVAPELLDEAPAAGGLVESLPPQAATIAANKETPSSRAVVAGAMRCSGLFDMNCSLAIILDLQTVCARRIRAAPSARGRLVTATYRSRTDSRYKLKKMTAG